MSDSRDFSKVVSCLVGAENGEREEDAVALSPGVITIKRFWDTVKPRLELDISRVIPKSTDLEFTDGGAWLDISEARALAIVLNNWADSTEFKAAVT